MLAQLGPNTNRTVPLGDAAADEHFSEPKIRLKTVLIQPPQRLVDFLGLSATRNQFLLQLPP